MAHEPHFLKTYDSFKWEHILALYLFTGNHPKSVWPNHSDHFFVICWNNLTQQTDSFTKQTLLHLGRIIIFFVNNDWNCTLNSFSNTKRLNDYFWVVLKDRTLQENSMKIVHRRKKTKVWNKMSELRIVNTKVNNYNNNNINNNNPLYQ